jgi:hypothetical protein
MVFPPVSRREDERTRIARWSPLRRAVLSHDRALSGALAACPRLCRYAAQACREERRVSELPVQV